MIGGDAVGQDIIVRYRVSEEGWIYTEDFCGMSVEGRENGETGICITDGKRTLVIPCILEDREVYSVSMSWDLDESVEKVIISDGISIICRGAFAGWTKLRCIDVPPSVYEITDGAFAGTAIPERRRKALYKIKLETYDAE